MADPSKSLIIPLIMEFHSDKLISRNRGVGLAKLLAIQEQNRELYWTRFDHFNKERLEWRASITRHLLHLCPGEKILEIGAGHGALTQALLDVTRNECEITVITFSKDCEGVLKEKFKSKNVVVRFMDQFPGDLVRESYDYVTAHYMLENKSRDLFLHEIRHMLKPGGGLLMFELNPWNPYYRLRHIVQKLIPLRWSRPAEPVALNRYHLYAVLSELGYVNVNALPYDFLYSPILSLHQKFCWGAFHYGQKAK